MKNSGPRTFINARLIFASRTARWFFSLLLCFLLFPAAAFSSNDDDSRLISTATREGRLAVFDDVWETIDERYYDPTFHGVDWQGLRVKYRKAAAEAKSTKEFYDVLRQMIAGLRDAHTRIYSPEDKFDWWNPRFVTVGLTLREVEGAATVVEVDRHSAPARAGIRAGDVIVAINNVTVTSLLPPRAQNASAHAWGGFSRARSVARLLEGTAGSPVKLTWQKRDGQTQSATFVRYWNQRLLGVHFRNKHDFAIIELEAFTQSVSADFGRQLPDTLRHAKGVILDLRANGGGDAEAMADIASAFLRDGVNLGQFVDRGGASFELQTSGRLRSQAWVRTDLPLVVLTSESTSSAAEILASVLQKKGRARIVGTRTCGCVLAIRSRHALPDGGVLDVSEFDYRTADGVRLEGAGVAPDDVVMLRRDEIYSKQDSAIKAARAYLKNASH